MATEKQKQELSRLKQRAFNRDKDGETLSTLLEQVIGIGDLSEIASSDLTSVPGSFADLAAVQSYLATVIPEIETRLDDIESKVNSIITQP